MKPVKLARCMPIHSPFHTPEHLDPSNLSTVMFMALSRSLLIRDITIGCYSSWTKNITGQKLGTLCDNKGREYMSREFEAFALIMASRDCIVLRIALSRMALQKGPIAHWKKVLSLYNISLACFHHSGEKLWLHFFILTTELSLLLCQIVHLMKHSLAANLISLCCVFGAVLLMSWFRRTSNLLGDLDHIWRSVFSLGILRVTRHGSSTVQGARR